MLWTASGEVSVFWRQHSNCASEICDGVSNTQAVNASKHQPDRDRDNEMEGGRFRRLRGLLGLASHKSDEIGVHSGVL